MSVIVVSRLLDHLDKAVTEMKEIPMESIEIKDTFLTKLETLKAKVLRIKVVGEDKDCSIPSGVTAKGSEHPLMNDKVLKNLCGYLDTPSKESYETIKNLRLVCQKWNNHLSPRLFRRSIITKPTSDTSLSSFLEVLPNPETESFQSTNVDRTSLKIKSEWLENKQFLQWIQLHGHKFTDLSLSREVHFQTTVFPLLYWLPNLENLHLNNINFNTSHNLNLKHLLFTAFRRNIGQVNDSLMMLLSRIHTLESLSIHNSEWSKFQFKFFGKFNKPGKKGIRNVMKNVNKLELVYLAEHVPSIISTTDLFPNLTQLRICLCKNVNVSHLLDYVSRNLVKFHLDVVNGMHKFREKLFSKETKMLKLEELTYTYCENRDRNDCESSSDNFSSCESDDDFEDAKKDEDKVLVNATEVLTQMPKLKCWIVRQCKWKWVGKQYVSNDFTSRGCANKHCYHHSNLLGLVQPVYDELVSPEDKLENRFKTHSVLEKVEFACCQSAHLGFTEFVMSFNNLKHLSIWVFSDELSVYLGILTYLPNLKWLRVQIGESIDNISSIVNLNFPQFRQLEEFCLERCTALVLRDQKRRFKPVQYIAQMDKAHEGFSKCRALRILTFRGLKIDKSEWETFGNKLRKSKHNLVLNAFDCLD